MSGDQLPYSPAAEQAVIHAILMDPDEFKKISLSPADFYIERNRWIWEAITAIMARGDMPDFTLMGAELDARGKLREMGGHAFLIELLEVVADSWNAEGYAAIVKDRARRRSVLRAIRELTTKLFDESAELQEPVSKCIEALTRQATREKGAAHISEALAELWDEIEKAQANPKDLYGIPTGFLDWDKISHGIQPGTVVLLTGEPGVGKSLMAAQVVINAAGKGFPCAYYSMEMGRLQVVRRSIAQGAKVSPQAMLSGKLTYEETNQLVGALEAMARLPVYLSDCCELTTMDLRVDLNRLKSEHGVQLAVIDYEALLLDAEHAGDVERSTIIARRIHNIAKELHIGILSIGDMLKAGISGERTGQAAAAGSGKSLHDRDEIILMRSDPDDKKIVYVKWEKMREGLNKRSFQLLREQGYPAFHDLVKEKPNAQRPGGKGEDV
jgi:replicative DNA helicase